MAVKVIDLFAGAGGFGVAANLSGCDVALSLEIDKYACATLHENKKYPHGEIVEGDIGDYSGTDLLERGGISANDQLIVVGGPPCQPFSKAAYWTDPGDDSKYRQAMREGKKVEKPAQITQAKDDSRRNLVQEYFRIVEEVNADAFVFENVTSILHPRNKRLFQGLVNHAEALGYQVEYGKLNAVEYGVAQRRERVFIVGSKAAQPKLPSKTHFWKRGGSHDPNSGLLPASTVAEVTSRFGGDQFHEPEEEVSGRWAEHLRTVPPGMNYKAHTAWAGHPNPTFVAETRFWNFLLKLDPQLPSWTLAATPGPWTGPFHWDSRRLRIPEMAAIQAFPDDYTFVGSRREQVRQVGNAVPPLLASQVIDQALSVI